MIPAERHLAGDTVKADRTIECDVAIVGTGAGGAVAAETLANAGLQVVMIEEGPLRTREHFRMREDEAYADLYQDIAGRATRDGSVFIMQGRAVGGTTVVNWTTSFRTPPRTLAQWQQQFGLTDYTPEALAPWFGKIQRELSIRDWDMPPNANNAVLARASEKLGWDFGHMQRNVTHCANLGYCGMGCPLDAKQSMLVTKVPAAMKQGAWLLSRTRAERLLHDGKTVTGLECSAMKPAGYDPAGPKITVRARHYIVSGGAINSPGLLLRSKVPDPYQRVGKRTFLHPVAATFAIMPEPINGWSGAPQSVYSDLFLWPEGDAMGYKLEVPPLQPVFAMANNGLYGARHAELARSLPHANVFIALTRDGFHDQSVGGTVTLRDDGSPELDYPITGYHWEALKRSLLTMTEGQFAAGAKQVMPNHNDATLCSSWDEARAQIQQLPMAVQHMRVGSAHVMGGCGMGRDPKTSVVDPRGRFHHLEALHVMDGSVFPTSIGANPQWSIYGTVARMSDDLAQQLTKNNRGQTPVKK
jgi:choline dehydrogenase-like flavoprotein